MFLTEVAADLVATILALAGRKGWGRVGARLRRLLLKLLLRDYLLDSVLGLFFVLRL